MIYLILFVALVLRLVNIDQSLWLDEASQALTAQRSISDILFNNGADFQPPFSYLLSHFWIQFGNSEVWLRLLPIMFGIGAVWMVYLLGKKLFNPKVGLLAAFFLAIAPYHIYYSQEFRMYSMVTFFCTVSFYYFIRLLEGPSLNKDKFLFILSSALILYTHYMGVLVLVAQFIYLVGFEKKKLKLFLPNFLLVGLSFSVWLPFFMTQLKSGTGADIYLPGWTQMLSLSFYKAIPLLLTKFVIGRIDFDNTKIYLAIISVVFVVLGVAVFPLIKKLKEKKMILVLCWFLIPIILTFIISFKLPMFQPFRLLFILPAFLILIALGLSQFKKCQLLLTGVFVLFLLAGNIWFFTHSSFWREDWRSAISAVQNQRMINSEIIYAWPEPFAPVRYYADTNFGIGLLRKMPASDSAVEMEIEKLLNKEQIIYFSYLSQLSDPNQIISKKLSQIGFKLVKTEDFRGVGFVYYYQKSALALN